MNERTSKQKKCHIRQKLFQSGDRIICKQIHLVNICLVYYFNAETYLFVSSESKELPLGYQTFFLYLIEQSLIYFHANEVLYINKNKNI